MVVALAGIMVALLLPRFIRPGLPAQASCTQNLGTRSALFNYESVNDVLPMSHVAGAASASFCCALSAEISVARALFEPRSGDRV